MSIKPILLIIIFIIIFVVKSKKKKKKKKLEKTDNSFITTIDPNHFIDERTSGIKFSNDFKTNQPPQQTTQPIQKEDHTTVVIMKNSNEYSDTWRCPDCDTENSIYENRCILCRSSRP